jgi:hypothetical protein
MDKKSLLIILKPCMTKLVKGSYNAKHGIEMTSEDGVFTVDVYKYPDYKPQTDSLLTIKCGTYEQASLTFSRIVDNITRIEEGYKNVKIVG